MRFVANVADSALKQLGDLTTGEDEWEEVL